MQIDHLKAKTTCKHAGCQCIIDVDEEYCSEYCRRAGQNVDVDETAEERCGCGHEACSQP